jgi:hypothetical protein
MENNAPVVIRAKAGIQYAAASRSIFTVSGILDRPPEPVVRPAKGRTGWRTMTGESALREIVIASDAKQSMAQQGKN